MGDPASASWCSRSDLCILAFPMPAWSVYLLRTGGGTLYTGIAMDVDRRFREHSDGRGAKYLRGRGPLAIVYRRKLGDHGLALRVERRLKRLKKCGKESLVASSPSRRDLLRDLGLDGRDEPGRVARSTMRSGDLHL